VNNYDDEEDAGGCGGGGSLITMKHEVWMVMTMASTVF
jgi:hypothetical protein